MIRRLRCNLLFAMDLLWVFVAVAPFAFALLWYFRERWIALIRGFFAWLGGRRNDDGHI